MGLLDRLRGGRKRRPDNRPRSSGAHQERKNAPQLTEAERQERIDEAMQAADKMIRTWKIGDSFSPPRRDILGSATYWKQLATLVGEQLGAGDERAIEANRIAMIFENGNSLSQDVLDAFVQKMNEADPTKEVLDKVA